MASSILIGLVSTLVPWGFKAINFKEYIHLSSHINENQHIGGQFKVATVYNDKKTWWGYSFKTEIPEIVGHYLNLNLSFVGPTKDFNVTSKEEFFNAALELMNEEKIDYILNFQLLSA